jgi:predicted ABC-type ATPase
LNPDRYRLTVAEHQSIFDNDIKNDLFVGAKPSAQPVAVIFGGQPGAGKSAMVNFTMLELVQRGGAFQIIGDDLRGYHPRYALLLEKNDKTAAFYTDRDTGQWVEKAIAYAIEQRLNIVVEGTMRDNNKVAQSIHSLRNAGYEIDVRALAVTERLSQQGIIQRYEYQKADRGTGRMTTLEAHKAAYDGMPATLEHLEREKLANCVTIYRRGAEVIYTNELKGGEWIKKPQARATLEAERNRPMTLQELRSYVKGFDDLIVLLMHPDRQASAEEIKTVKDLRQRALIEICAVSPSK